jgi:hypothetical protein
MNDLEQRIKRFGEFVNHELKNTIQGKYIVWQFYMSGNELKSRAYKLADNTDKQTLDEYKAKGWIVIEKD